MITEKECKAAVARLNKIAERMFPEHEPKPKPKPELTEEEKEAKRVYMRRHGLLYRLRNKERIAAARQKPERKEKQKLYTSESRKRNREKVNARNRRWRAENRERSRAVSKARRHSPERREHARLYNLVYQRKLRGVADEDVRPYERRHRVVTSLPSSGVWLPLANIATALEVPLKRVNYVCHCFNTRAVLYKNKLYADIAEIREALSWRYACHVRQYYARRPWLKRPVYSGYTTPPLLVPQCGFRGGKVYSPELISVNITERPH